MEECRAWLLAEFSAGAMSFHYWEKGVSSFSCRYLHDQDDVSLKSKASWILFLVLSCLSIFCCGVEHLSLAWCFLEVCVFFRESIAHIEIWEGWSQWRVKLFYIWKSRPCSIFHFQLWEATTHWSSVSFHMHEAQNPYTVHCGAVFLRVSDARSHWSVAHVCGLTEFKVVPLVFRPRNRKISV